MLAFLGFAAAVAVAAWFGSRFMPDLVYRQLRKPSWNPPDMVFGPVWTVLYVAIAWAGYLAWQAAGGEWSTALSLWAAQLLLNAAWTWLFFGRHNLVAALVDVALLFVTILAFIAVTAAQDAVAAALFVPYALWVGFATALTATIWWMNSEYALERLPRRE